MSARTPEAEPLLTPAEVATMFRVDPKTVTRWAKAGKLTSIRTLGGHRANTAALDRWNGGSAPVAECHGRGAVRQRSGSPGTFCQARCRGRSALRGGSHDA